MKPRARWRLVAVLVVLLTAAALTAFALMPSDGSDANEDRPADTVTCADAFNSDAFNFGDACAVESDRTGPK
jgi:hypothetical protein